MGNKGVTGISLSEDFLTDDDTCYEITAETSCGFSKTSQLSKLDVINKQKVKKNVRFSTIHVREYDLCLGDNPAVARGAPISLDWNYHDPVHVYSSLEDFEQSKHSLVRDSGSNVESAPSDSLRRSSLERVRLLKELGYSRREIMEAMNMAEKVRRQRFQTMRQCERVDRFYSFVRALRCSSSSLDEPSKFFTSSVTSSTELTVSSSECIHKTQHEEMDKQLKAQKIQRESQKQWQRYPKDSRDLKASQKKASLPEPLREQRSWREMVVKWHLHWRCRRKSQESDFLDIARHKSVILKL
mmetsp:Transcript_17250/g.37746  ORF Transcript_17250/g.37746 Transcript_17250/m.37746 type:complete len:299 (-) Transcript_17250:79-975(-)|eukprot:CAMPEP_0168210988 /NCGR_PEP_ID=MMETSP0140_2-20121125/3470_1 /TAXON_ID=44445 /ORGANISM="Pseudo-nitzschia australis, Strain 10249 10 AB" /LENGTH=298 /DNA_ID=CAMNT_0008137639 /DNA_START=174 /DNA_END=1070 /DNA_ORIENTATION=-